DDGTSAGGRITDAHGRPINNAIVSNGLRTVFTDPFGKFSLSHVHASEILAGVRAEGFEDVDVNLSGDDENDITLERAAPFRGVIRDSDGSAIGGRVEAGFELNGVWHVERASADRDGAFVLRTLPNDIGVRIV